MWTMIIMPPKHKRLCARFVIERSAGLFYFKVTTQSKAKKVNLRKRVELRILELWGK